VRVRNSSGEEMKVSALNQSQNYQYNPHFQGKKMDIVVKGYNAITSNKTTLVIEVAKLAPAIISVPVHDITSFTHFLGVYGTERLLFDCLEIAGKSATLNPFHGKQFVIEFSAWSKLNVVAQLEKKAKLREKLANLLKL